MVSGKNINNSNQTVISKTRINEFMQLTAKKSRKRGRKKLTKKLPYRPK